MMSNVDLVVDPSHAIRWSWHVRDGVVECPLPWDRFIAQGGTPIWNASLLKKALEAAGPDGNVAVVVGDFRLGNSIVLEDPEPAEALVDGFVGIARAAMGGEYDLTMRRRGMAALRQWHEAFGARARYVFWSLFGRQIQDRLAGRNLEDRRYRHPAFNYQDVVDELTDLEILDLGPLLKLPMHEVSRLFIDSSNHPSQVGYELLGGMVFEGIDARNAYNRAVERIEEDLLRAAGEVIRAVGHPVLLTGRSVWLDTLSKYLGAEGTQRLADAGVVVAPLESQPGRPTLSMLLKERDLAEFAPVIFSAGGKDLSGALARTSQTERSAWQVASVIDWETSTADAIRGRGETPQYPRVHESLEAANAAVTVDLAPHMVEQGPLGMPSWAGILEMLRQLAAPDFLEAWARFTSQRADNSGAYFAQQRVGPDAPPQSPRAALAEAKPIKKALVATHHLFRLGGSELVALELADELRSRGYEVDVYAPFVTTEFADENIGSGCSVIAGPSQVRIEEYDLVYSQHQTLTRALAANPPRTADRVPVVVHGHLSPYEPMEFPGAYVEKSSLDILLCNSPETAARIATFGPEFHEPFIFRNPAPRAFAGAAKPAGSALARILWVSNFVREVPELIEAERILTEQGIEVTRIGHPDDARRVTPEDIAAHDAVISIGKTVQYALRGRRPVYCYAWFGGPGWLTDQTHDDAAWVNFSGRNSGKRDGARIAEEILEGHPAAAAWVSALEVTDLAPYQLETVVDELLQTAQGIALTGRQALARTLREGREAALQKWTNEADTYNMIDRLFGGRHPKATEFAEGRREFARRRAREG